MKKLDALFGLINAKLKPFKVCFLCGHFVQIVIDFLQGLNLIGFERLQTREFGLQLDERGYGVLIDSHEQ